MTGLGLTVGVLTALLLGPPIEAVVGMMLVTPIMTGLAGAILGSGQWLEIRKRTTRHPWWIPATCAGLGVGLAVGAVAVEQGGRLLSGEPVRLFELSVAARALSFAALGLSSGLFLGLFQGLLLRHAGVSLRGWMATCALALGLGFPLSSVTVDLMLGGLASPLGLVVLFLVSGLFLGAATARPLMRAA